MPRLWKNITKTWQITLDTSFNLINDKRSMGNGGKEGDPSTVRYIRLTEQEKVAVIRESGIPTVTQLRTRQGPSRQLVAALRANILSPQATPKFNP